MCFIAYEEYSDENMLYHNNLISMNGSNEPKYCFTSDKDNNTLKLSLSTVASAFSINGNEQYSDSCILENEGKYNLKVVSTSGKKTTREIIIDKTKPTTNVKNTTYNKKIKITFSDKLSGIKSAKLNNKNIKANTIISKTGKYTLVIIDNAGNKKNVQFVLK